MFAPHLEFAVPAWSPYLDKDKAALEKVQRRATKTPHSLRHLPYQQRHETWHLTTLSERRTRGDLIQQFKSINKIDDVTWQSAPAKIPPRAGHRERFHREFVPNCEPRFEFFHNRVANAWNALSDLTVSASSVNSFQNHLDKSNSILQQQQQQKQLTGLNVSPTDTKYGSTAAKLSNRAASLVK